MDDSCAVCADTLEWVAYGSCGHQDVCSTCVARLRFICNDRRCCICKTECNVVFVTKALGDYTRMISDFSVLPSELREGRVGPYWYHEDTQAFFDDVDHYKMIKAMCRLSCNVCDKMEEQANDGAKRRVKFRNIEQLKGHLFHKHKLVMCSLCLEGRKVFICEQKLYTRAQLNQHINTGDSEVDGSESERGGFMGHPICEFCKTPFYGDNELYSHMSTEHYTCHICQRQHPGQYEYYKNYDDLEIHFRRDHFLCEDEGCLAKKFVVFQSEAEMKRHNAIEHGGRMSRAKRNAALQIPTSFRYRRSNEQDHPRGRGRTFHRESSDDQLSLAIQSSLETFGSDGSSYDPSSSSVQLVSDLRETDSIDPLIQPFESLATTDSEPSRYLQALGQNSRTAPLEESSFPPLPMASCSSQQKPRNTGLPNNTMAAHLKLKNNKKVTILHSGQALTSNSRGQKQPSNNPIQLMPAANVAPVTSWGSGSGPTLSSYAASTETKAQAQARPISVHGLVSSGSQTSGNHSRISHSASAPNLTGNGSLEPSVSDFPPVSAMQTRKLPISNQPPSKVENVQAANKSLVEKIRSALQYDEEKYSSFKDISGQYRQGLIDTKRYLENVQEYDLSHLVLELASLLPDAQKQRELVETYNASLLASDGQENGLTHGSSQWRETNGHKKGKGKSMGSEQSNSNNTSADSYKGKSVAAELSNSRDTFANSVISTVQELRSGYKPSEEEVEVLSKDGYRASKGKSKAIVNERDQSDLSAGRGLNQILGGGGGGNKQRKKTSKFQRVRLGDGSMAALLDLKNSDPDPEPNPLNNRLDSNHNFAEGMPVRGVWRRGGGQKLFS
ncbi:E3 ubiquitin-protein ligase ZNF598-like [Mangifera indica]|uniref:E3 ubiquitin-protein ligase ZNF598-like n=1 Tax=Mangifera indica TaxID=29780 RepID=UPI001CFAF64A|nr:E3 ubiquitin-protein ligase ZNF598-like [Mangifera indica]